MMEVAYEGPSDAQIRAFIDRWNLDRRAEEVLKHQTPEAQMVAIHNFRPTATTRNMPGRFSAFIKSLRESGHAWTTQEASILAARQKGREGRQKNADSLAIDLGALEEEDDDQPLRTWIQFHTFEGRAWWWCKKPADNTDLKEASEEFFFEDDRECGWRRFCDKKSGPVERWWWWNEKTEEWFFEPLMAPKAPCGGC